MSTRPGQAEAFLDATQIYGVLPSQYLQARQRQVPERRLMLAVLHDALLCLDKYRFAANGPGRRLYLEAEQWVVANDLDWPYSFESICGVLDLDANAVRQRLQVTS